MPSWQVQEEPYLLPLQLNKRIWFKSFRNIKRNFLNPYKIRDLKYVYTKQALMLKNGKLRMIRPFCDLLSLAINNTKTIKIMFQI